MVERLRRWQESGNLHFVTCSCWRRLGYLGTGEARDLFETVLEKVRVRYRFAVVGYVVMPEHVHLLVSEPEKGLLAVGLQALKLGVSKRSQQRPFWTARYYDFNVFTEAKRLEKLNYMHWNPMKRGWWIGRKIVVGRVTTTTKPASQVGLPWIRLGVGGMERNKGGALPRRVQPM